MKTKRKIIIQKSFTQSYKILLFVVLLFSPDLVKSQGNTIIMGKVVSAEGKPVSKATVSIIYPYCKNCTEDIKEVYKTEDDGTFILTVYGKNSEKVHIFVEENRPNNFWIPIYAPDSQLSYLPEFRGSSLNIKKPKNSVFIGSIPLTIKYVKFELNIPEILSRPKNLPAQEITLIAIQIRHSSGKIVDEKGAVPKEFWNTNSRTLKIALPRGVWILDVFFHDENKIDYMKSIKIKAVTDGVFQVIPFT